MTSSRARVPRQAQRRPPASAPRVTLRAATRKDIPLLVEHRHRMFRAFARWTRAAMARHDREYRTWVGARLRSGLVRARIAYRGVRPVGSGVLWWREDQPRPGSRNPRLPYLMSIFTEPSARGEGIASRIVGELVREARAGHATRIALHASEMGRSVYARLGFERTWEMRRLLDRRYARARRRAMARGRARAGSRA